MYSQSKFFNKESKNKRSQAIQEGEKIVRESTQSYFDEHIDEYRKEAEKEGLSEEEIEEVIAKTRKDVIPHASKDYHENIRKRQGSSF